MQQYKDIFSKYNNKDKELSDLYVNYNNLETENNDLKNKCDELLQNFNTLYKK